MTFKNLILILIFSIAFPCMAQAEKYPGTLKSTVVVDYFNAGMGVNDRNLGYVDYLRDKIISGLTYSNRVNIFDADDSMELRAYDARSMGSVESMKKRYSAMVDLGIDYVIECDVSQLSVVPSKQYSGKWTGITAYTIKLVNPQTGNVVTKLKYEPSDSYISTPYADRAIALALDYVPSRINVFILDNFRIEGQILDIVSYKKDIEAKDVTLNVGPENAALKNSKFEVHRVLSPKATTKIGEVKITEIKGDKLSLAKVVKGGKEIKDAIDKGEILMIISDKSGFWDQF